MNLVRFCLVFVIGGYSTLSYSDKEVGYKDLKIGQSMSVVNEHCENRGFFWRCYEIQGLNFRFFNGDPPYGVYKGEPEKGNQKIGTITVDMTETRVPILDLLLLNPNNSYHKLKKSFEKKYSKDFDFSDRDQKLFKTHQVENLYHSYEKGQVVLNLSRFPSLTGVEDIHFSVQYRNPELGKDFLKNNKPSSLNTNDF